MSTRQHRELVFIADAIAFALTPALVTVVLYILDKAQLALTYNNLVYFSTIIVGVVANPLVSANLDRVNEKQCLFWFCFCVFYYL